MGPLAENRLLLAHPEVVGWLLAACVVGVALLFVVMLRVLRRLATRLREADARLAELRGCDPLTGLVGRAEFEAAFEEAVQACDRGGPAPALLYIGLDNFRPLNEGYGHGVGDAVLVEAAGRLSALAGGPRRVSRLGGDEFALLIEGGLAAADAAAARALRELLRPYPAVGLELQLGASVGIAAYPEHGSRQRLIGHAAQAMRSVKAGGGGALTHYDPAMAVNLREQAELLQDLRQAVDRQELQLVYQPKIDARSLQITAAEALLRWEHPRRGWVLPTVFVPLAERHGLIAPIGRWVIEEACRQAALWRERGLHMRVAVNISAHQLRQDDFVEHIEATLRAHRVPPGRLTCEITETVAMEDTCVTRSAFERLGRAGLHVSIDDFGTGHSSLATLRRLPAAELKIDRAFVSDLDAGERPASIIAAIVQMAHALDVRVVAEGVETEAQRDALLALGCDELQGYLFAKPMSAAALALWAADDGTPGTDASMFRASLFDPTAPAPLES